MSGVCLMVCPALSLWPPPRRSSRMLRREMRRFFALQYPLPDSGLRFMGMSFNNRGLCAALLICAFCSAAFGDEVAFDKMKQLVRRRFPQIAQLSTAELAEWLQTKSRAQPILLDVRTAEEFRVSHLRGAIQVDPAAKAADLVPVVRSGRPIVTYCSVGYRSSAVAERLVKAGVPQVRNLKGSIFQWANEGRALESDGKPAAKVHPYNATYGMLLNDAKRASVK